MECNMTCPEILSIWLVTTQSTLFYCQLIISKVSLYFSYIYRQRLKVIINGETLPVLALNEAFIGENDPSQ